MATYNEVTFIEPRQSEVVIIDRSPRQATILEYVGLPGKDGINASTGGASQAISLTADIALGGHRVVIETSTGVTYADNTVPEHKWQVLGITLGAATLGATILVQTSGSLTEPSWAFTPNSPIYLSSNGLITQTVPTVGFLLPLGMALTSTSILYNPLTPIDIL